MSDSKTLPRLAELDALRGLAAGMVVLFHYTWQASKAYPAATPISHGLFWGGYGVELFFAISGFVIFITLERTRRTSDFIVSRFARLFPAYWAGIALTSALVLLLGAPSLSQPPWVIATNLTMLQGFLYVPGVDGVYWSLTVELSFYFCMWALWRARLLERVEVILLGWLGLKLLWWLAPALPSRFGLVLVQEYIPFFAIGIAAYRVWQGKRRPLQQAPVLLAGLAVMLLTEPASGSLAYLIVLAVFAALAAGKLGWIKRSGLIWLGAISYPLYLVHQLIGYAVIALIEALGASPVVALGVALAAALGMAEGIRRLIEQPALAMIRESWRARQGTPASISAQA